MASAWGKSWGSAWGNSWGTVDEQIEPQELPQGGGSMWGREEVKRNDDDRVIMAVINKFLDEINR